MTFADFLELISSDVFRDASDDTGIYYSGSVEVIENYNKFVHDRYKYLCSIGEIRRKLHDIWSELSWEIEQAKRK